MSEPNCQSDPKAILDALLLEIPGVAEGKMFGYPAFYVNGKLFACIYGGGVGLKVPHVVANELLSEDHIGPFQPHGKPKMKEWVQIVRARPDDYRKDIDIFRTSVEFVGRSQTMKWKKT